MNKKLICIAVGASLAAASGVAGAVEDTNTVLIPYVVKDSNRTTLVTLIGSGYGAAPGSARDGAPAAASNLHLQYWTKSTTDSNTAACAPNSVYVPFTENDIATFDTAGVLGYPLFDDTTNPAALGVSISYPGPRHGYLVMVNQNGANYRSYWLELDLANGGAHGDAGALDYWSDVYYGGILGLIEPGLGTFSIPFNPAGQLWPGLPFTPGYFTPDPLSDGAPAAAVAFWPSSVASTAFTVTPTGSNMVGSDNNTVVLQVMNSAANQGAYDRNENGVDGTVPVTVRCVGRVTPAQLMPGVVTNAAWAKQGGWGFLANLGDAKGNSSAVIGTYSEGGYTIVNYSTVDVSGTIYYSSYEYTYDFTNTLYSLATAVVYQVDQSSAGGKFMTNATRITTLAGAN